MELDAMLAPIEMPGTCDVWAETISHPENLCLVNPFAPVMLNNSAALVDSFVQDHPGSRLAVLLRPCELRALIELRKRGRVRYHGAAEPDDGESLMIIGVDCAGTYSSGEYAQRLADHKEDDQMIHVNLSYERQLSYLPSQVRAACQMCDSPAPEGTDVVIGTIGLAGQGSLLVIARDEDTDKRLRLQEVTDDLASEWQVASRELMVGKLVERRAAKRAEWIRAQGTLGEMMDTAMAAFACCTLCADCLDACPLYDGELSGMLGVSDGHTSPRPLLSELVSVSRWLTSCSGCGMCGEACEHGVALAPIVTALSHRIQSKLHYRPGDPAVPLPWNV
jgi:formate dehydrogenase subunit beta